MSRVKAQITYQMLEQMLGIDGEIVTLENDPNHGMLSIYIETEAVRYDRLEGGDTVSVSLDRIQRNRKSCQSD